MIRWLVRGGLAMFAVLGAFVLFTSNILADPPLKGARLHKSSVREFPNDAPHLQSNSPGYTLLYSFSSDPSDNTYVGSFTSDVPEIYAWATIVEENGAAQKQFTVETEFIAPDGTPVDSDWFEDDTGTVTTYPAEATSFGDENVARRFIAVAGTPNATQIGQWTVNFSVGNKLIASGNFTLTDANDTNSSTNAAGAEQALLDAGYDVLEFQELEGKNGNVFAFVIMTPASQDLYSSESTQQIVDGLAALRQAFPDSGTLYTFLRYDPRYEIAYWADALDVQAYLDSNDFDKFARTISIDVYDNEEGKYLGKSSKDFINKKFGAGSYQAPPAPPLAKHSNLVGSIRVTVSPSELPADGASKAIVTVHVYDKKNQPVNDAEVEFEISGSGDGTIRPRVTSTDTNGEGDAIFTAGKKNGSVTITATSGGVSGSGIVTIGTGSSDQAADNVLALLNSQGLNATKAGYIDSAKKTVAVIIDLGDSFGVNQLSAPIIYGMTALRSNYPDATTLVVVVPYQNNYLMFPATSTEYGALGTAISKSKTEAEKQTAFTNFLTLVFNKSTYVDNAGKQISSFKDFANKNFTGR